jgi:hypothetical protein
LLPLLELERVGDGELLLGEELELRLPPDELLLPLELELRLPPELELCEDDE